MPERELRELLEQLRAELAKSEALDQDVRQQLSAAIAKIEDLIGHAREKPPEERSAASDSLIETLGEARKRFESSHPTLFEVLGRVADTLAKLGI